MAQKTGALIFDETADRYDIRFDSLSESLKIKLFFALLHNHFTQLHCIFHLSFKI